MAAQDQKDTKRRYVLVAPDGGWGYAICLATIINFVALTSFVSCFGMIFNDFFVELGMDSKDVALLTGINAVSLATAGFFTGPLLKVFSMRKLSLAASAVTTAGTLGTAFVNSQAQLIFCQGLLQNIGCGIIFTICCTAMNDYFNKRRLVFLSFANTVTAAATMVAPFVVQWSKVAFGFQGTLILIGAVSALTFVGSSLLQPVAWHMKKEEVEEEIEEGQVMEAKLLLEKLNEENPIQTPVIKLRDVDNVEDLFPDKNGSLGKKPAKGNRLLNHVKRFFDWPLLREFMMTCICYGVPTCMFTENTFVAFLPQYLYARGWSNDSVAFAFSLQGFGDIATRILLIFSNGVLQKLGGHFMYVIGLMVGVTAKLALLWVSEYKTTLAIIMLSGISRCTITVLFPIVVAETVSAQVFPLAFGMSMALFGFSSIIIGPALGALRDATGDYAMMFYALAAILAVIAVAMAAEAMLNRRRSKNKTRLSKNKD